MKTEPNARIVSIASAHLTEAQFGELLDGSANKTERALTPAEEHVLLCEQCAAELGTLREALVLFRGAATAYAEEQLRNAPPIKMPVRTLVMPLPRAMYFVAAATLALAAFLPMKVLRQPSAQMTQQVTSSRAEVDIRTYATESDEALLEDVDRAASASVPDSMQALADPMGSNNLPAPKSSQRKD